jgi:hypothetical protein
VRVRVHIAIAILVVPLDSVVVVIRNVLHVDCVLAVCLQVADVHAVVVIVVGVSIAVVVTFIIHYYAVQVYSHLLPVLFLQLEYLRVINLVTLPIVPSCLINIIYPQQSMVKFKAINNKIIDQVQEQTPKQYTNTNPHI